LGCGFGRSLPCLWHMALATFTLCGGVSKRLRPSCLASTPGFTSLTLLRSKRSRARCHSSWLWFLGRARSHARRGIEIASPLSMLQLPLQGCQEFEAHPGRDGVHDSFFTYLFTAAGAAGAVSFQLKGTREDESLSFSPAPCGGASLCAVGMMFPPALLVRVLEMGLRSSTRKGKGRSCCTSKEVQSRSVPMHRLLLPQLLGYLPFQSYATSTLPMGSLRAWEGECLRALFLSSVAHDISHFHAVRRGVEGDQVSRPCLDCRAPQVCSSFRFLCMNISLDTLILTRTTHDADAHSALKRCARGLECTQHSVHSKS